MTRLVVSKRLRRPKVLAVVLALGTVVAIGVAPSAANAGLIDVHFIETNTAGGDGPGYGTQAWWQWDESGSFSDDVPCNSGNGVNYVETFVRGSGFNGTLKLGTLTTNGPCGSGLGEGYSIVEDIVGAETNTFSDAGSLGVRLWTIVRVQGGSTFCSSSYSFCWLFKATRTDGTITFYDVPDLTINFYNGFGSDVRVGMTCNHDGGSACNTTSPKSGSDRIAFEMQWKHSGSAVWEYWAGKDSACADTGNNAAGHWDSATQAEEGFNTTPVGSLPHC